MSGESSRRVEKVGDEINKRQRMIHRRWASTKRGKDIHTGRDVESKSDIAALQYGHGRAQRKVEDNRVGREELLVAGDDKGSNKVCRRVWPMPKTQKPSRSSSGQINAQLYTGETLEVHKCGLYS